MEVKENKRRNRKPVDRVVSYQAVFSTNEGQKVLFDLMFNHHMLNSTFVKDPIEMALKEGERNVVLRILSILKIDVKDLAKKIEDGLKHEESYNS